MVCEKQLETMQIYVHKLKKYSNTYFVSVPTNNDDGDDDDDSHHRHCRANDDDHDVQDVLILVSLDYCVCGQEAEGAEGVGVVTGEGHRPIRRPEICVKVPVNTILEGNGFENDF